MYFQELFIRKDYELGYCLDALISPFSVYRKPKNVHKSGKKKEELPSFLSKMPTMAKEYEPLIKSTDSVRKKLMQLPLPY